MSKTIVLLPPRKNTDWAAQLKLISESLEVSQADLARAYQVERRDISKAYHTVCANFLSAASLFICCC